MSGAVVDEDGDPCVIRAMSGLLWDDDRSSVYASVLTVSDEEDDLFWHQDERESEKDVLLRHLRQGSREDAADMVLHSEILHICRHRGIPKLA